MPERKTIQWHPGFFAGLELELKDYQLTFESEHEVTRGTLSIDILVIKKLADEQIDNEIGEFFRKHNIVEYKSPEDELSIDVFYKVQAYAGLYKISGEHLDEIPAEEVTISLFRDAYPRELITRLKHLGATVIERHSGIYEIKGVGLFPTQVITTGRFKPRTHSGLKILTRRATREDIESFLSLSRTMKEPGELERIHSILQVSTSANRDLYTEIYKEEAEMCAALEEIMEPSMKKAEANGAKKLSILIKKLLAEKRYDDLEKASNDDAYRESLYAAYGIA